MTLLFFTGCVTFSTFQSAEVIDAGEVEFGLSVSVAVLDGESNLGEVTLMGRVGLGYNFDLGLKMFGFPPFGGYYGDVKYQFMEGPLAGSAVLGVSYFGVEFNDEDQSLTAFYPALLFGNGTFYGGPKMIYFTSRFNLFDTSAQADASVFGFVLGGAFGNRLKLMPEVNVYFLDEVLVYPGLGLKVAF
jgi:hypothetical protein